jgi:hypothetical protein
LSLLKNKPAPTPPKRDPANLRNASDHAVTLAARRANGRTTLVDMFTAALCEDFRNFGASAIVACREQKPDVYVRVIANLLPKEVRVSAEQDMSDSELELALLRYLAGDVAKIVEGRERGSAQIIEGEATARVEKPTGDI